LRVTIRTDKITGHPLGYGYIEFDSVEAAKKSKSLDQSLFKGRQLTVLEKRINIPRHGGKPRGGLSGRGRGRGHPSLGFNPIQQMFNSTMNGGRGMRGHPSARGRQGGYYPNRGGAMLQNANNQNMLMLNAAMMMAQQ